MIEETNITVNYLGPKLQGIDESNVREVEEAVRHLASIDARIILVHTLHSVELSCWFHRYGLYGPKFVLFATTWNIFHPDYSPIPPYLSWCTKSMVYDVFENWVYFGIGYMREVYGNTYTDSLGLTFQNIVDTLEDRIYDSHTISGRDIWWPEVYDPALAALQVVGKAEQILNERFNSTLSEWTTDTDNFRDNGYVISEVFKDAIYEANSYGTLGYYNFDKQTRRNSNGFKPNMF